MRIDEAQQVMLRTHLAALRNEHRANALLLESPGPASANPTARSSRARRSPRPSTSPSASCSSCWRRYPAWTCGGLCYPSRVPTASTPRSRRRRGFRPRRTSTSVEPDGTWHKPGAWNQAPPRVGVLFLDEFGQAEDEVKKCAAELIYKGAVGTTSLPHHWRVIAAQNRMSDRSGVLRELMFLVNRRCRLSIDASLPAWLKWAERQPDGHRPHYLSLSFAQKNPDVVFRDTVPEGTDPFCTPRTLCLMDQDLQALRSEEDVRKDRLPLDDIAREVCAGWIGAGSAGQFYTHIKYADQTYQTSTTWLKTRPRRSYPRGATFRWCCAYMLAHHVNDDTAQPIMRYIGTAWVSRCRCSP
jgi:hypothetical protein